MHNRLLRPILLALGLLLTAGHSYAVLHLEPLEYDVTDAEFSKQLNSIVMVSEYPKKALYLLDPIRNVEQEIALPLAPAAVSIGPGGQKAAVAHNGWVSHVDLVNAKVIKTLPVSTNPTDIVLRGNTAYLFPSGYQGIVTINLVTGETGSQTGYSVYGGTRARLQPGNKFIYGAGNGLSPSDIEKYGINGGKIKYLYDSPYHGDYEMCGDLWFSENGGRIFTRCGNIFRASTVRSIDMTYAGALSKAKLIKSLAHSDRSGKIVLIRDTGYYSNNVGNIVQFYEDQYLNFKRSVRLPDFPDEYPVTPSTNYHPVKGEHVFLSRGGYKLFAIVRSDDIGRFGLVRNFSTDPKSKLSILPDQIRILDTQQFDLAFSVSGGVEHIDTIDSAIVDGFDLTSEFVDKCTETGSTANSKTLRCPSIGLDISANRGLEETSTLSVEVTTSGGNQLSATAIYTFRETAE